MLEVNYPQPIYLKLLPLRIDVWCWIKEKFPGLLDPGFYNTKLLLYFLSVSQFLSRLSPLGPGLCEEAGVREKMIN